MKKKPIISEDGRCPNPECKSNDVEDVGKRPFPRPMGSPNFPKPTIPFWECRECKTRFQYKAE